MFRLFCIIALLFALCVSCNAMQSSFPALIIPNGLGVNIHFSGKHQSQVDQMADGGFRFIRMDFFWGSIETSKGVYNFKNYDDLVDSLATRGIRALLILDYGNGLYGPAPQTNEQGRQAFAAFAKAAAAHFKGRGVVWDLWNEPNRVLWGASPNPNDYVELAKAVYPAIKEADPEAILVGPAVNRWDYGYIESVFRAGLLNYIDGVTLHPYDPKQPEDAIKFFNRVRSLMKKYAPEGRQIPILSGEWGYNTSKWQISLDAQAQYIARMFLTNTMCGCPVSIWYDWRNDGTSEINGEHHYGVVYYDYQEKPAYVAMKTLSIELSGYSFCRRIISEVGDDYALLFRKGSDCRLAAWTTGNPHKISIPMDVPSVTIVSLMGEKKKIDIENGKLTLALSGSVQYVEPTVSSSRWAAEANWEITKRDGYKWDGSTQPFARATLSSNGINPPLYRVIKLDASTYPVIEALPPVDGNLMIKIKRPSAQSGKDFYGKIAFNRIKGIKLSEFSIPVKIVAGEESTTFGVKIEDKPESVFSFSASLIDQSGQLVTRLPSKQYSIIDAFICGKAGDEVTSAYAVFNHETFPSWGDKSGKGVGEAKLTYVSSPSGLTGTCSKLDYSLSGAKCLIDVTPANPITLSSLPHSCKLWIKGDGNAASLRTGIVDAGKEIYQPDWGLIDFTDWRCIEIDMTSTSGDHVGGDRDGRMTCPLNWDKLLVIDNMARDIKGSIYLGSMLLCYE